MVWHDHPHRSSAHAKGACPQGKAQQTGVAAVEFALVAVVMLSLLLGLSIYWRAYQAQQSLTRAAGDGARLVHSLLTSGKHYPCHVPDALSNQQYIQAQVLSIMSESLAQSGMPQTPSTPLRLSHFQWACANGQASFVVRYALPAFFGDTGLLTEPTELVEKSVVNFAPIGTP